MVTENQNVPKATTVKKTGGARRTTRSRKTRTIRKPGAMTGKISTADNKGQITKKQGGTTVGSAGMAASRKTAATVKAAGTDPKSGSGGMRTGQQTGRKRSTGTGRKKRSTISKSARKPPIRSKKTSTETNLIPEKSVDDKLKTVVVSEKITSVSKKSNSPKEKPQKKSTLSQGGEIKKDIKKRKKALKKARKEKKKISRELKKAISKKAGKKKIKKLKALSAKAVRKLKENRKDLRNLKKKR